jgi:multidrug efflux pump subunit AcrA (membrane-fusion protein)
MNRASIITLVLAVLVIISAVWFAAGGPYRGMLAAEDGANPASPPALDKVSALGRIEPRHGVIRVAGPPRTAVVIQDLSVEEGAWVQRGQVIAVLLGIAVQRAEVARLQAELANAEQELKRNEELFRRQSISESDLRTFELKRDVSVAALLRAQAELELSSVRAPIDGQVIEIHAREGERVDHEGIFELGDTSAMYVVAEVYETDIGRIHVGQRAMIRSPVLTHGLVGKVERIGLKIGKKDVLSTDPVADADARVVEVDVRLLEPAQAAALSNLRVDVVFDPPSNGADGRAG